MTPQEREQLEQAELEGQTPGTPKYELRVLSMKVEACQQRKGHASCNICHHNMFCDLVQSYRKLQLAVNKGTQK